MRQKIAQLLFRAARRLDPLRFREYDDGYEPVQLGIGYHLSKKDVRDYRKTHTDPGSHRRGLDALVEDTKQVIAGNIAAGLIEKGLLTFTQHRTLWTADVSGRVIVYRKKQDTLGDTLDEIHGSKEEGA